MFTPPDELPESVLRACLETGWSLRAGALDYLPVGFGSHHWKLTAGPGYFVTVDDLRTRRRTADEPLGAGFHRSRAALAAARALRAAGRDFVVAPLPSRDGEPMIRLGEAFAVSVYPVVAGESLEWDDYTPEIRLEVLDLLVAVHTAPPEVRDRARPEDHAIQFRENLAGGRADPGLGPYARPAAELLDAHLPEIRRAVAHHDDLAGLARAEGNGPVLTHGEPHPGNAMRTGDGLVLIDWDTALAAPPERDLWHLDPGDGSVHAAYTAATGTVPRPEVVELYRLRWDLTEIAQAVARFREPHGGTADDDETWANLEESITNVAAARQPRPQ